MRQALGRGLDALIPKVKELTDVDSGRVEKVPVNKISPNRYQPRRNFDEAALRELAQSIQKHGLAQPICVSYDAARDAYELIAGERRLRATQLAGLKEIDAVIKPAMNNEERLALSLIENIQRQDLNAIDLANAYRRLIDEFDIPQNELAAYCGKSKAGISNTLRLLDLESSIQSAVQAGVISEGHARALLTVSGKSLRMRLFHTAVEKKMSVRELETLARQASAVENNSKGKTRSRKPAEITELESELQKDLGTRVEIRVGKKPGTGTLTIHYLTYGQLERLAALLRK